MLDPFTKALYSQTCWNNRKLLAERAPDRDPASHLRLVHLWRATSLASGCELQCVRTSRCPAPRIRDPLRDACDVTVMLPGSCCSGLLLDRSLLYSTFFFAPFCSCDSWPTYKKDSNTICLKVWGVYSVLWDNSLYFLHIFNTPVDLLYM